MRHSCTLAVITTLLLCSTIASADAFFARRVNWPALTLGGHNPIDDLFDSLSEPHFGFPLALSDDRHFSSWDTAMSNMFDRWQVVRKCREEEKQSLVNSAKLDIQNKDQAYEITAALPGVQSSDVEVHLNGEENSITIKAKKERTIDCRCGGGAAAAQGKEPRSGAATTTKTSETADTAAGKTTAVEECRETRKESFVRTFTLPSNADLAKIQAQFGESDNALHISIPKSVPSKAKLPITVTKVDALPAGLKTGDSAAKGDL